MGRNERIGMWEGAARAGDMHMEYEEELLVRLGPELERAEVSVGPSSADVVDVIESRFPLVGSKIDWDSVPGAIVKRVMRRENDAYAASALNFVRELLGAGRIDGLQAVLVVGDGPVDVVLSMTVEVLMKCLARILDVPQHTYVTPPDGRWCIVMTMEGDLCFGVAPCAPPGGQHWT